MRWSQPYLAEKIGVSVATISGIERCIKFVEASTLVLLARALHTEPYELLKPKDVVPDKAEDIVTKTIFFTREAIEKAINTAEDQAKGDLKQK